MWVSTISDPVPSHPAYTLSVPRTMLMFLLLEKRCPRPSAGLCGGNLADLSKWPSLMSYVYMWVKSLHTDDDKSLQKHLAGCSDIQTGDKSGSVWTWQWRDRKSQMWHVRALKWEEENRDRWVQQKEVRRWLCVRGSWQGFWRLASWNKSFYISSHVPI